MPYMQCLYGNPISSDCVLRKLFHIGFPYKHCYFQACLPTRQNGVENCDKAYQLARGDYSRGALTQFQNGRLPIC